MNRKSSKLENLDRIFPLNGNLNFFLFKVFNFKSQYLAGRGSRASAEMEPQIGAIFKGYFPRAYKRLTRSCKAHVFRVQVLLNLITFQFLILRT